MVQGPGLRPWMEIEDEAQQPEEKREDQAVEQKGKKRRGEREKGAT